MNDKKLNFREGIFRIVVFISAVLFIASSCVAYVAIEEMSPKNTFDLQTARPVEERIPAPPWEENKKKASKVRFLDEPENKLASERRLPEGFRLVEEPTDFSFLPDKPDFSDLGAKELKPSKPEISRIYLKAILVIFLILLLPQFILWGLYFSVLWIVNGFKKA